MTITIRTMKFDQILTINELGPYVTYPTTLDIRGIREPQLRFADKPYVDGELCGPGIYFITGASDNSLIYIGIWNDEKTTVNCGRYWKHIRTLTLRGNKIGKQTKRREVLDSSSEKKVADLLRECNKYNPVNDNLSMALINLMKSEDFYQESVALQMSYKRAAYANCYWGKFSGTDAIENIKSHFEFHYIKLLPLVKERKERKKRLEVIEASLVEEYKPLVNYRSTHNLDIKNASTFIEKDILEFIAKKIDKKSA